MEDARLAQLAGLPLDAQLQILVEDVGLACRRVCEVMSPDHPDFHLFRDGADLAPDAPPLRPIASPSQIRPARGLANRPLLRLLQSPGARPG